MTVANPWQLKISPRFGEFVLPVAVPNVQIQELVVCTGFRSQFFSTSVEHIVRLGRVGGKVKCDKLVSDAQGVELSNNENWNPVMVCECAEALDDYLVSF